MSLQTTLATIVSGLIIGGFSAYFDVFGMGGDHLVNENLSVRLETEHPRGMPHWMHLVGPPHGLVTLPHRW